jgi:hypothetical protein
VFYGNSAIYALHVTDEATARAAAKTMGRKPLYAYAIEASSPRLSAAGAFDHGGDDEQYQDEPPL